MYVKVLQATQFCEIISMEMKTIPHLFVCSYLQNPIGQKTRLTFTKNI